MNRGGRNGKRICRLVEGTAGGQASAIVLVPFGLAVYTKLALKASSRDVEIECLIKCHQVILCSNGSA